MATRTSIARLAHVASSSTRLSCRAVRPGAFHLRINQNSLRRFSGCARGAAKKYSEDHEWIELESDGQTGVVGISEYAQKALGDVVFVELPEVDNEVSAGDSVAAVESVKSASDIMSPVSGTITEVNSILEDQPTVINKNAEGEGWIFKIKVSDKSEMDKLMDKGAYDAFTEE